MSYRLIFFNTNAILFDISINRSHRETNAGKCRAREVDHLDPMLNAATVFMFPRLPMVHSCD